MNWKLWRNPDRSTRASVERVVHEKDVTYIVTGCSGKAAFVLPARMTPAYAARFLRGIEQFRQALDTAALDVHELTVE